jgi:hypothetical protein
VRAARPALPVELAHVIEVALAKHPRDRFATATAMASALRRASRALPDAEWRSLAPGGGDVARPSAPDVDPPAPATSRTARAGRLDVPTARATPSARDDDDLAVTVRKPPLSRAPRRRAAAAIAISCVLAIGVAIAAWLALSEPATSSGSASGVAPVAAAAPDATQHDIITHVDFAVPDADVVVPAPIDAGASRHRAYAAARDAGADIDADSAPKRDDALVADGPHRWQANTSYSTHKFDPIAFLPRAQAYAREAAGDVQLVTIDASLVSADGRADLDPKDCCWSTGVFYDFRATGEQCSIRVAASSKGHVTVMTSTEPYCSFKPHTPRCTLVQIWAKVKARFGDAAADERATIAWNPLGEGKWSFTFTGDDARRKYNVGAMEIDDRCP